MVATTTVRRPSQSRKHHGGRLGSDGQRPHRYHPVLTILDAQRRVGRERKRQSYRLVERIATYRQQRAWFRSNVWPCLRDTRAPTRYRFWLVQSAQLQTDSLLGNQMMRRSLATVAFAIAGLVSVVAWAAIDARICAGFDRFCAPRPGECGGGVDACASTLHSTLSLFGYVFGPPAIFAALGFILFARRRRPLVIFGYFAVAVATHWFLTFLSVRILHT